jgi:hypothetical protein
MVLHFIPFTIRWSFSDQRFDYYGAADDPAFAGWHAESRCNSMCLYWTDSMDAAMELFLSGRKITDEAREQLGLPVPALWQDVSPPDHESTIREKLKNLAELCRALDGEPYLVDVGCKEDEDLVKKWRAAWKAEL